MNAYAPVRNLELWRQTTVLTAGRNAAPAPYHCASNGTMVCVRDYACPDATQQIKDSAGVTYPFAEWSPPVIPIDRGRVIAGVENPADRLRSVWLYRICDAGFRAAQPHRFAGIWMAPFGDFVRWVWAQDPLGCDVLIRPQWSMIPRGAELYRIPGVVTERSEMALTCAEMIYKDDFVLWDRAMTIPES